jgi:uncharacterized membrane protein
MDRLVQFFFKYEPAAFRNGQFTFELRPGLALLLTAALLLAAVVYLVYRRPRVQLTSPLRVSLMLLRVVLLTLLATLLLGPAIVVSSVIPHSSYVAVLADNSRSMQLTDEAQGHSRLEAMKKLLAGDGNFRKRLEEDYRLNLYGFADVATRIGNTQELDGTGTRTDLVGAMSEVLRSLGGMPVGAVVLISDGASNGSGDIAATLKELKARNVPVYTIGAGNSEAARDAELAGVIMPHRVLLGSSVTAEVLVRIHQYSGTKMQLAVSEDGRAVKTQEFTAGSGEAQTVSIEVKPATPGWHRYTFAVNPVAGELTVDNNSQDALVDVATGPSRILYVEGEPRWELGKLRAALSVNEKNVQLVSLLRTGNNKFYRQGVAGEGELAQGFPATAEELFTYQGLIMGSVEAAFFTPEQLKNIEAFVSRRGGGLLAIGGRLAFDGGRFANTPLADLLPFHLSGQQPPVENAYQPVYKIQLSPRGQLHPITRLKEDVSQNQKAWAELPPVSLPEVLSSLKPGATVLLEARRGDTGAGPAVPVLAEERYGRGRTIAFTVSDTWRWQMKLEATNNLHETFWRQMLRYLVSTVPDQVAVTTERDNYASGDQVRVVADVRNRSFEPVRNAHLTVKVSAPSGAIMELPLRFTSADQNESYVADFVPDEPGTHQLELLSTDRLLNLGDTRSSFLVTDLNREAFDAAQHVELLQRVASETGGKYYSLADAGKLIPDLIYRQSNNSERVTRELWDMPINFLLVVGLVTGEWFLRKRVGLA